MHITAFNGLIQAQTNQQASQAKPVARADDARVHAYHAARRAAHADVEEARPLTEITSSGTLKTHIPRGSKLDLSA